MQIRNTQTLALAEVDEALGARLIAEGGAWEGAETPVAPRRTRAPRTPKPEPAATPED